MKRVVKENQVVVAGYVGTVDKKTDTLVVVSIANRKGKDDTEWVNVTFTNPKDGEGAKLADLADNYIEKGQFIAVIANEVTKGEYKNLYVSSVELGPKNNK